MSNKFLVFIFCFFFLGIKLILSQNDKRIVDSLYTLSNKSHDTTKVKLLCKISRIIEGNDPDSSTAIAESALIIAKKKQIPIWNGLRLCENWKLSNNNR